MVVIIMAQNNMSAVWMMGVTHQPLAHPKDSGASAVYSAATVGPVMDGHSFSCSALL